MKLAQDHTTMISHEEYHLIQCTVLAALGKKRSDVEMVEPDSQRVYSLVRVCDDIAADLGVTTMDVVTVCENVGVY